MKATIFTLLTAVCIHAQPIYNSTLYSLSPNMVLNPQFAQPPLPPSTNFILYINNMSGWTCQSSCECKNPVVVCSQANFVCNNLSVTHTIDLDSIQRFDNISQIINIVNATQYLFTIKWIPPLNNALGKKFRIDFNTTTVIDIRVANSYVQELQNQSLIVLPAGPLTLTAHMYGNTPDGEGILMSEISLQQLITNQIANQTNTTIPSNAVNSTNPLNATTNITANSSSQINQTNSSTTPTAANQSTYDQSGAIDEFKFLVNSILFNNATNILN